MAINNGGGSRGGNPRRSRRNRKPDRERYSGMMSTARDKPLRTAAAIGGVAAAGVFLWSRRNQISGQIGDLAEQVSGWRKGMGSDSDFAAEDTTSDDPIAAVSHRSSAGGRSQAEIAEEALTLKEIGKTP